MRITLRTAFLCAVALAVAGCGDGSEPGGGGTSNGGDRRGVDGGSAPTGKPPRVALRTVGRFQQPVHAVPLPGTDLVAVVEQGGRVVVASGMRCSSPDQCPKRPVSKGTVVVDLRREVSTGGERGLLGMALHPKWPDDERIYLNYTDRGGSTRVEQWRLAAPAATAVREQELLRIRQPYPNHNGGHLAFGPDGLLYVGMGDGGSGGDPEDRAQEDDELLGKMLRLDVDKGGDRGYAIPPGNLSTGAPEVWAVGLRNPWRFSFDADTGDLWIADVGQDEWEEVNAISAGQLDGKGNPNFGWRRFEGFHAFDEGGVVGPGDLVQPVLAYGRDDGCSVTGGVVYRGASIEALRGWYVFADYCGAELRLLWGEDVPGSAPGEGGLRWEDAARVDQVVSIAESHGGELLVLSHQGAIEQVVQG